MDLIEITDLDIPELQIYRNLRDNLFTKDNSFIADSSKVVNLLLQTPVKVKSILATIDYYESNRVLVESKDIDFLYVADKKLMKEIVGHNIHHGVMMHGIRPAETPVNALGSGIVLLDSLTQTENVGSIARSAVAAGVDSLMFSNSCPHPYGRRALRVSMGYTGKLKICSFDSISEIIPSLQKMGYKVFAAEADSDATMLQDIQVPDKWVLLLGHEGKGVSKEVIDLCDETVMIEMAPGVKSYNVSIAASILMYSFKNSC